MAEKPAFLRQAGATGAPMGPGAAGKAPGAGTDQRGTYPVAPGGDTAAEAVGASEALPRGGMPVRLGQTTYGGTAALGAADTAPAYGSGKAPGSIRG